MNLQYSILDGGSQPSREQMAEAVLAEVRQEGQDKRLVVLVELKEKWIDLLNNIDNVVVIYDYLIATTERASVAEIQYSSGQISFDTWMIIENEMIQMKRSYLNAKINVLMAESAWLRANGGGLEYEK